MISLKKTESALLIGFIAVASFPLLYLARQLDNNTLSSWRWLFNGQNLSTIILYWLLAIVVSYILSKYSFFERRPVFWLFSLSFLTSVSLWGEPELLLDSGRYFLQAKYASEYGLFYFIRQWGDTVQAWTDMPLVPLINGMVFSLAGESRVAIQLLNSTLFSLCCVLTFFSAQRIIGKENSFYAGLFLLGMPYLLVQVPLFLVDMPAMFFLSLALFMFLSAVCDGGTFKIVLASASIALAMIVKYSTWPMLTILPLLLVSLCRKKPAARISRAMVIFTVAAVFAGLYLIPKLSVISEQIAILKNYQRPALSEWQEGLFSTFFFQIQPFITVFAGIALFQGIRKGNGRLLIVGVFSLVFFYQIPRIRYIIPLLPLLAVLASSGLGWLQFRETRRFVCWLCVGCSLVLLHTAYLPFFQRTGMANIQKAGRYLDSLSDDMVEVVALPQAQSKAPTFMAVPQLDLFTGKKIVVSQGWEPSRKRPQGYHPLLFTWEMKKPLYYSDQLPAAGDKQLPLVIISGTPVDDSTPALHNYAAEQKTVRHFSENARVFRYKTFVTVIH